MGGGIGQWLLFRAGDGSLSLFALVVPSCSATPVHDHLAWGLVGLYRGAQDEEIYETADGGLRLDGDAGARAGRLLCPPAPAERRPSRAHDLVGRLGLDPSADQRHRLRLAPFIRPETGAETPFRSGYVNVDCAEDDGTSGPI